MTKNDAATYRRFHGDRGAGLVEYSLLVALIALVCFGAIQVLGGENEESIDSSASAIGSAVN